MTPWLRRLLYFLLLLIWLLIMSFPLVAVILATQGQLEIGNEGAGVHVRLFLVQESDQEGVGVEWSSPVGAEGCRQGRIAYVMWEGDGVNARYCTCVDTSGSVISSEPGACPIN